MFGRNQFLRKTKISTRLTVSLIAMCLFPILILSGFSYNSYQETIYSTLSASTKQGLVLYSTILDSHISKCESISDGIMMDSIVQATLKNQNTVQMPVSSELGEAATKSFNNLYMWESYMKGFTIYNAKGQMLAEMGFVNIEQSELEAFFIDFIPKEAYKKWFYAQDTNGAPCIVLCRKIFSVQNLGKLLGYVLIYLDPGQLVAAINAGSSVGSDVMLKIIVESGNNRIVHCDGQNANIPIEEVVSDYNAVVTSTQPYFQTEVAGNDSIVVVQGQGKTGWLILGVLPKAELVAAVQKVIAPLAWAMAFILMLGLASAAIIQRSIQKPIEKIINFTKDVAQGNFDNRLNDDSSDEIGILSHNIDSMVTQISGLFEQNRIIERKRHSLELEVLQYQINPHFLFNTLNSFQYIAELNGIKTISQGIANLCMVLKYTLYNTEESPTLQQEIEVVDAYLKVQRIKFAGMFSVNYNIDPVSADATVIRFLLQPIVENSILHGLGENELHIDIQSDVRARRLIVVVSDDGKGFNADDGIMQKSKFSGIGLRNVQERLEMQFGGDCTFLVESEIGRGTRTTIELPFIPVHF